MTKSDTPGAMLKTLRLERRLTLSELSGRTGLPMSTLSKVENDKMYLTYDKLQALSTGLGIDIGVLFKNPVLPNAGTPPSGRRSVHKIGEGKAIETHLTSYLHLASDLLNKQFIPLIAEVRARSLTAFGEMLSHPGEEFTYVLEGALEFHSHLYTPLRLDTGESVFFDSGMPHAYVAVSDGPCRVLTICSSTEAQLFDAIDRSRPARPEQEAGRPRPPGAAKAKTSPRQPGAKTKAAGAKAARPARRGKQ
jgi:transcriptional regulator with XRE-family HTH domain